MPSLLDNKSLLILTFIKINKLLDNHDFNTSYKILSTNMDMGGVGKMRNLALLYFFFCGALLTLISCHELSKDDHESWKTSKLENKRKFELQMQVNPECQPVQQHTDPEEIATLKEFYHSTGGTNWSNSKGWLKGDPCMNGWFGVCCSEDGHIVEINLPSNGLVGQLPLFSLQSFTALRALRFPGNYLMANIPSAIFDIKTLEIIDLEYNQLDGALLPDNLEMPLLKNLSLSNNKLGGLLPTTWATPKLQVISLSSNRFTGSLPSSLSTVANLVLLDLSKNYLSGSLPTEYGSLVFLEQLWLFENPFDSPEIPAAWMKMQSIRNFQMNGLVGEIPMSIGNDWPNLEVLIIVNSNMTEGVGIPTSICNLKKLQYLHVFYSNISGSIPDCICNSKTNSILSINLSNNRLTGEIPSCIGNLEKLRYLYLSNNNLIGPLPTSLGKLKNLYSLDVSVNRLSGSIPFAFSSLASSLNQLDMGYNYLSNIDDGLEPFFIEMILKSCNIGSNPFSCPVSKDIIKCGYILCSGCNTGGNHTSCNTCLQNEFCGWCVDTEMSNCLSGYTTSPYYPYTCKEWYYGKDSKCPK